MRHIAYQIFAGPCSAIHSSEFQTTCARVSHSLRWWCILSALARFAAVVVFSVGRQLLPGFSSHLTDLGKLDSRVLFQDLRTNLVKEQDKAGTGWWTDQWHGGSLAFKSFVIFIRISEMISCAEEVHCALGMAKLDLNKEWLN